MTTQRSPLYELSPAEEAEIRADIAFQNEYDRFLREGVDVLDDEGCDLCAGLTLDL